MSLDMSTPVDTLGPVEIYDETTGTVLVFSSWLDADHFGLTGDPAGSVLRDATAEEIIFEVTLADLIA